MPRERRQHLDDIHRAVVKVRSFVEGMDFDSFARDEKTQDAVIRNLEVIAEASRAIPETVKKRAATIEWPKIVGMRHVLAPEYFGVSLEIVWDVIQNKLEILDEAVLDLLDDE
jgi:uncharacterized protein with HEPN domain